MIVIDPAGRRAVAPTDVDRRLRRALAKLTRKETTVDLDRLTATLAQPCGCDPLAGQCCEQHWQTMTREQRVVWTRKHPRPKESTT